MRQDQTEQEKTLKRVCEVITRCHHVSVRSWNLTTMLSENSPPMLTIGRDRSDPLLFSVRQTFWDLRNEAVVKNNAEADVDLILSRDCHDEENVLLLVQTVLLRITKKERFLIVLWKTRVSELRCPSITAQSQMLLKEVFFYLGC